MRLVYIVLGVVVFGGFFAAPEGHVPVLMATGGVGVVLFFAVLFHKMVRARAFTRDRLAAAPSSVLERRLFDLSFFLMGLAMALTLILKLLGRS
jgi:hypothetical protein